MYFAGRGKIAVTFLESIKKVCIFQDFFFNSNFIFHSCNVTIKKRQELDCWFGYAVDGNLLVLICSRLAKCVLKTGRQKLNWNSEWHSS
jgi:hypothetical protein